MERLSKQVILVRKDLKMNKGKIGAQVAHASMGAILKLFRQDIVRTGALDKTNHPVWEREVYSDEHSINDWLNGAFTKICLSVDSEEQLNEFYEIAKERDLPHAYIVDSGRTVFDGVPTATCLSIGPCWADELDEITGNLRLL